MSNIIIQGNEINARKYLEKITIEGIGEEKSLNPRLIVAGGSKLEDVVSFNNHNLLFDSDTSFGTYFINSVENDGDYKVINLKAPETLSITWGNIFRKTSLKYNKLYKFECYTIKDHDYVCGRVGFTRYDTNNASPDTNNGNDSIRALDEKCNVYTRYTVDFSARNLEYYKHYFTPIINNAALRFQLCNDNGRQYNSGPYKLKLGLFEQN